MPKRSKTKNFMPLKHFATANASLWQLIFALTYLCNYLPKFRQRFFEFRAQQASPCIQNPIIFRGYRVKLGSAQSKTLPQQPFCPITVVRLADRLLCRRDSNTMKSKFRGQNENRHKTAFETLSIFINPQKISAFEQPTLLVQTKT